MTYEPAILTVSQLNRHIRFILENDVGEVQVEGEISSLSKPSSGHLYFTLKDTSAQLRCVFFRNYHISQTFNLKNGQKILARGKLSVYEARGDYQLIIEHVSESGKGELFAQFEQLKKKLAALGLFDSGRKRPIPDFPNHIGLITSSTGAAVRDILTTLNRRFPIAKISIYPSEVQGKKAAQQLVAALERANRDSDCDVIILGRGGGSMEDLWGFNDEILAHAIASGNIPIVTGIGHETDFTIADFVADLRAATPTAAAEAVTPDRVELLNLIKSLKIRLYTAIDRLIYNKNLLLTHEIRKITTPEHLIGTHWQTLDYLKVRLMTAETKIITKIEHHLHLLNTKLNSCNPKDIILQTQKALVSLSYKLHQCIMRIHLHNKQVLAALLSTLHAVSPLATLERGYAIATHQKAVLFDISQIKLGDAIDIRLAKGSLTSQVIDKKITS